MRMKTEDLITKEECLTKTSAIIELSKHRGKFYVYFLIDPFSYQIKYIGKGRVLASNRDNYQRCFVHLYRRDNTSSLKNSWLNKLAKKDKEPLYVIWEFYEDEKLAYEQENNFIYMFGRKGKDKRGTLLNVTKSYEDSLPRRSLTSLDFISKAVKIHGDLYGYERVDYVSAKSHIVIYCNKCRTEFEQTPTNHLMGRGCPECGKAKHLPRKTNEVFLQEVKAIYLDKFDLSNVLYKGAKSRVDLKCNDCGYEFSRVAGDMLSNITGCKKCTDEMRKNKNENNC